MRDTEIDKLIEKEFARQRDGLELIASENFVSRQVMEAMGSCLTNKYAEGLPGKRYYGGCEVVDEVEELAISRLKALFGAVWANVQPHSGSQANAAVMLGCLKPGDSILGFDLSHGGHLTHGSPVNFSGRLYRAHFYGVNRETGCVDYDAMEQTAMGVNPRLIICGASSYAREWDYARIRKIADSVGALVLADISHPAGLIAGGCLNNPLEHCDIVTTTTHKTLRGPRGGVVMLGRDYENTWGELSPKGELKKMSTVLDAAVFPGSQGGPLEHVIAAKAVAFYECSQPGFKTYTRQVISNAQQLAKSLTARGYEIVSGGTDNHLMLIDLRNKNITGKEAERVLGLADITVNKNMVPFDDKSPFITSGIRIGTAAATTRGMKESEMEKVASLIDEAIQNAGDDRKLHIVRDEVRRMMTAYEMFAW